MNRQFDQSEQPKRQPVDSSDGDEFRLAEQDAATADELTWLESGQVRLPLPEQDREAIEQQIRRNRRFKISISELILLMTAICVLLALANWVPLPIYAVALGCATILLLFGLFQQLITARYRAATIGLLLFAYVLAAVVHMVRS